MTEDQTTGNNPSSENNPEDREVLQFQRNELDTTQTPIVFRVMYSNRRSFGHALFVEVKDVGGRHVLTLSTEKFYMTHEDIKWLMQELQNWHAMIMKADASEGHVEQRCPYAGDNKPWPWGLKMVTQPKEP